MQFKKRIESLLKIARIKFEFSNLEIRSHKRQVSFLIVKTVKCKLGISFDVLVTENLFFLNHNIANVIVESYKT